MAEQFKYTVRCCSTHESLGPASEEIAAAYASALQAGQNHIVINPHAVPRKVYVEHGYREEGHIHG